MANDLPPEILRLILSELELKERIKQRLVCRKWKEVIESLKIDDLSVVDSKFDYLDWMSMDLSSVNYRHLIQCAEPPLISFNKAFSALLAPFRKKKMERSLLFDPKNPMFSRLRRLFICLTKANAFHFEEYINHQFEHLEELSFFTFYYFGNGTCLKLDNLRVLSMQSVKMFEHVVIQLDLPKLEKLKMFSVKIQFFTFLHPQSLLYLTVAEDHESIFQFTNLQVLTCFKYRNPSAIFSNLPQLKEIRFDDIRNVDLAAIYSSKQSLGRSELKMVVLGLDFKYFRQLNLDAEQLSKNVNEFIVANYSNLGSLEMLSPVLNLHYNKLTSLFDQGIACDFIFKIPILKSMYVTKIESESVPLFFRFLEIYPNLCHLKLEGAFDAMADQQKWYDLLPDYCERLRELDIRLAAKSGDSSLSTSFSNANHLDLNFIFKFKYLQSLTSNLNMSREFALSMWRGSPPALKCFYIQNFLGKVLIRKRITGYFEVTLPTSKLYPVVLKGLAKYLD